MGLYALASTDTRGASTSGSAVLNVCLEVKTLSKLRSLFLNALCVLMSSETTPQHMAENIETESTAGYSPWSNGLLERPDQTLTEIIQKVKGEQECDWHTALDWALMPKNWMLKVHGYSPDQ